MTTRTEQAKDLLIEQYKESPNLNGLIGAHTAELDTLDEVNDALLNERGLDTAKGENLDVIGRIVVLDRPFSNPEPEDVFTFENPGDVGGGFTNELKTEVGGYYIGLDPINNQKYNDSLYRLILRAKIIFNTTKGTLLDMYNYAQFVFGVEAVVLERVGAVDINIARPIGKQERAIVEATFPLPAGVRLGNISFSTEESAFGFTGNSKNGGFGDAGDAEVGGVFSSLIID